MNKISLLLAGLLISFSLLGQIPGTLDSTFGTNGIRKTDYNFQHNISTASAIQDDGKIILAGHSFQSSTTYPTFARYKPSGNLDPDFCDGAGITGFVPPTGAEWIHDMILQPDGKILAIGYFSNNSHSIYDMIVMRLKSDGKLDGTFNNTGRIQIDFGPYKSFGHALAIQDDGKIIAVGYLEVGINYVHCALCRLNTDGTIDYNFGTNGLIILDLGYLHNYTNNVAIQGDKILIGGLSYMYGGDSEYITLCRLNSDGSLDDSFGLDGITTIEIDMNVWVLVSRGAMCLDDQDRILYGAFISDDQDDYFAIYRFLSDGNLDKSFGENGFTVTDLEQNAAINAVTIQSDGKIIAGGFQGNSNFAMVRYLENGEPDISFGTDSTGIVITNLPESAITSLKMSEEGKIIASGKAKNFGGNKDFVLARYHSGLNVGIETKDNVEINFSINPNPVADQAILSFSLKEAVRVRAEVINTFGSIVASITDEYYPEGEYQLRWDGSGLPAGVYIVKMTVGDMIYTSKIVKTR